jgi:diacylglycerol kinase (ATP)
MSESEADKKKFSIIRRAESFTHAGRGVLIFLKSTHNAWIHIVILTVAVAFGIYFNISQTEWFALILSAALVLVSEAFNTAIEIDMDLTSPDYHPYARDTKDVAAGAVLISAVAAAIVGISIFAPYLV